MVIAIIKESSINLVKVICLATKILLYKVIDFAKIMPAGLAAPLCLFLMYLSPTYEAFLKRQISIGKGLFGGIVNESNKDMEMAILETAFDVYFGLTITVAMVSAIVGLIFVAILLCTSTQM